MKEPGRVNIYGKSVQFVDIMPKDIHKPFSIILSNMLETYCLVDKVDEFKVSRILNNNNIEFIVSCEIGGAVLKPDAITLMGVSEYPIR